MIDTVFDDKAISTYSKRNTSIGVYLYVDNKYTGPILIEGNIIFANRDQAIHFWRC